jgi:hypothetical protein
LLDLSTLDTTKAAEDGATLEVRHPATGEILTQDNGEPITITLAGTDSDRFRKAQRANNTRRLRNPRQLDGDDIERDGLNSLVLCTLAWSGIALDGQELDCTPANVRQVYQRLPWLREQADRFVSDRANFLKGSSLN